VFIFFLSFIVYLFLVWSGEGAISLVEVVIGLILGGVLAFVGRKWSSSRRFGLAGLNPVRWAGFIYYLFGPFAMGMVKANIDVAKRVITGDIRPGIVKLNPGLKSELAMTVLADSITLTPGTLTVDVDEEDGAFYIHWINVTDIDPREEDVYGPFAKWARRLTE
jgi:multicomponent Na+:H+ antiporter subunit E